jgi:hypothetical protein
MAHIGMGRNLLLEIIIEVMNICKQLKKKRSNAAKKSFK